MRMNKKGKLTNVRNRFLKSKKGFEMQFNWIFVLIAGALILGFFVMIAQKQLLISQTRQEISAWQDFENIFSNSLTNRETIETINTRAQINFACTSNQCYLNIGKLSKKTSLPIFSPSQLNGGLITLWSKSFNVPFHVTNLLLLINDNVRFVIVSKDTNPLRKYLEDNLPDSVNAEFVNSDSGVSYQGNDHTRLIYIDTNPSPLNFPEDKYSEVLVMNNKVVLGGEIFPFNEDHKELLLAALFSKDEVMYKTQMKKVFSRIKDIAYILKEKARLDPCYNDLSIFDSSKLNFDDISGMNFYEGEIKRFQKNCDRLY